MDWKKLAVIMAAVLVALYIGTRLGGSDRAGQALAGGGANDKLIAFSHDGQATDGAMRLFVINPTKQKILVYKYTGTELGLITVRGYEYDQELLYTPQGGPGNGYDYPTIKKMVDDAKKAAGGG